MGRARGGLAGANWDPTPVHANDLPGARAAAEAEIARWLRAQASTRPDVVEHLRVIAGFVIEEEQRATERWLTQSRRHPQQARAAQLAVLDAVARRSAEYAGKEYVPFELVVTDTPAEREEVWREVVPDGLTIRDVRAMHATADNAFGRRFTLRRQRLVARPPAQPLSSP